MLIKPTFAHPLRKWFFAPAVAIALLLALLIPATPAPAASRATYYLSLGDSLAQGLQPVGSTHHGYADQLFKLERQQPQYSRLRLQKLGCGGESTASILHPSYCRYRNGSQLAEAVAFLDAHRGAVSFITLTLGANDIGDCVGDIGCALGQIQENLPVILSTLRAHAGPNVPIIGTNYYQPDLAQWFDDHAAAQAAADSVVAFNNSLEGLYGAAGSPVADVETAFASTDFAHFRRLPGAGLVPLAVYNICTWTWMCTGPPHGPDVHPRTEGYTVIARTIARTLRAA